jgi:hypothetical protein
MHMYTQFTITSSISQRNVLIACVIYDLLLSNIQPDAQRILAADSQLRKVHLRISLSRYVPCMFCIIRSLVFNY